MKAPPGFVVSRRTGNGVILFGWSAIGKDRGMEDPQEDYLSPTVLSSSLAVRKRACRKSDGRDFQLMRKLSALFSSLGVLEFHVMRSNVA